MNSVRITKALTGGAVTLLALYWPLAGLAADAKTEVLWLGQSATRITTPGGKVIMIDPYVTKNPKTPDKWKNLEALGKIDLILITHGHGDHLGDGPELAKKHKAPLYAPSGLADTLMVLGILPPELAPRMNKGGTIAPLGPDIKITMVHAEHSSELRWRNPATDKDEIHVGGEPAGFIIQLENGFKIYHPGDTGLFGDLKLIGDYYKPDLFLVPIGGHFVMSPEDAAFATKNYIKPKFAIPIHYGTLPGSPADASRFIDHMLFHRPSQRFKVFECGEGWTVPEE